MEQYLFIFLSGVAVYLIILAAYNFFKVITPRPIPIPKEITQKLNKDEIPGIKEKNLSQKVIELKEPLQLVVIENEKYQLPQIMKNNVEFGDRYLTVDKNNIIVLQVLRDNDGKEYIGLSETIVPLSDKFDKNVYYFSDLYHLAAS